MVSGLWFNNVFEFRILSFHFVKCYRFSSLKFCFFFWHWQQKHRGRGTSDYPQHPCNFCLSLCTLSALGSCSVSAAPLPTPMGCLVG